MNELNEIPDTVVDDVFLCVVYSLETNGRLMYLFFIYFIFILFPLGTSASSTIKTEQILISLIIGNS
jgi:hypothetical protein